MGTKVASTLALAVIVGTFLALSALYAVTVPPWNAPDEPAHYNYVRHVAEQRALPVLALGDYDFALLERLKAARFPLGESVDPIRYEGHQPPLFYLLATPVYWATAGLPLPQRVAALRMFSALFGALALLVAYATVGRILGRGMGLAAAAFIACVPMFIFIAASVNNDALGVLVLSLLLWALTSIVLPRAGSFGCQETCHTERSEVSRFQVGVLRREPYLLVGILLGLALLTKVGAYIGLGLVAAVALAPQPGERWPSETLPRAVRHLATAYGVAALLAGWWFVRNAWVYGGLDLFGWRRHADVVSGQPLSGAFDWNTVTHLFLVTFRSFWAQFGWMGVLVDQRIYWALGGLSLLATAGICWWGIRLLRGQEGLSDGQAWALLLLVLTALLTVGGLAQYNLTYLQPQGRYLYPAMIPIGTFFCLGLRSLMPRRWRGVLFAVLFAGMALLAVVCLFRFVLPDLRR